MRYKVRYIIGKKAIETGGQSTNADLYRRARIVLLLREEDGINAGQFFLHQILK